MILQPSGTSQARYSETDFSELTDNPLRIRCGIYMAVVSGTATLETATDTYRLVPQMNCHSFPAASSIVMTVPVTFV